jgi:hypothetical protein
MAGMSAWCVLADTLRSSLDFSLVAGDMQGVIAIIRDHKDPADQAQIADWLKEKVDTGQAPDRLAMSMVLLSLTDDAPMHLSYYRALIFIDSAICTDALSGGSLLEATIFLFGRLTTDQPTRRRERQMQRFKSARHAQRFPSPHPRTHNPPAPPPSPGRL